jgi:hypothetical protein
MSAANNTGSENERGICPICVHPRLSAAQYRLSSFRFDRSYEWSSVFPAALRARVTNGATFFGRSAFPLGWRGKNFSFGGAFSNLRALHKVARAAQRESTR